MHMMRWLFRSIPLIFLMLAAASDAHACSCDGPTTRPPCQNALQADQTDVVFVGTVKSISKAPFERPPFRSLRVAFAVTRAFRGIQKSMGTVLTADSGSACGYAFRENERYVVYASKIGWRWYGPASTRRLSSVI